MLWAMAASGEDVPILQGGNGAVGTWIALMRGINVGGNRPLPMARLRELCVDRGWLDPRTYIQSGNLLVDAPGVPEDVRAAPEAMIAREFGFATDVILRPAADWAGYVAANPFAADAQALPKAAHLCLSRDPLKAGAAEAAGARAAPHERIAEAGGALWVDYGRSIADSKLTPAFLDRCAGSTVTARNWNSILRIADLIAARA
jgi:uncharacterized protein (DUF1697 family)